MTSTFQIQEILARCLTEPAFLDSLIADREKVLTEYSLDSETSAAFARTDFRRIQQFSGFIGKVQHNHLWDHFPATRLLLQRYHVEIEVFAQYRAIQLSPELRSDRPSEKIRRFAIYLSRYAAERPAFAGLNTAVGFEHACWELRQSIAAAADRPAPGRLVDTPATLSWSAFQRQIPMPVGPLRIESFDCDPSRLVASILNGTFSNYPHSRSRLFVLQLNPQSSLLKIMEVEELTALLLSAIDGQRRVRSVISTIRRRALAATPPLAFRTFFEQVAIADLIRLYGSSTCE
jgi:hypothetical protein